MATKSIYSGMRPIDVMLAGFLHHRLSDDGRNDGLYCRSEKDDSKVAVRRMNREYRLPLESAYCSWWEGIIDHFLPFNLIEAAFVASGKLSKFQKFGPESDLDLAVPRAASGLKQAIIPEILANGDIDTANLKLFKTNGVAPVTLGTPDFRGSLGNSAQGRWKPIDDRGLVTALEQVMRSLDSWLIGVGAAYFTIRIPQLTLHDALRNTRPGG